MAITKSTKKIQFIKANKAAYQDIKTTYPHCIFFAIDDKCIIVDDVEYGLGSKDLADTLKTLVADITISGDNTIQLVNADGRTVGTPITISNASSTVSGLMSADDKKKFDSFFSGTGEGVNLDAIWNTIGEKGSGSEVQATTLWGGINEVQDELTALSNSKGQPSGLATLDETGVIPSTQLPSYVDDVIEVSNAGEFAETQGESGKIYITVDTGLIYRWVKSSNTFVEIPKTSAESITRLDTIQTKNGGVDKNYSIEKGVQEAKEYAKAYTDDSLSWYEDDTPQS